ncbi:pre-mRNA-splicing factor CWC21-like isoform X3 [Poecilia latipinna]|uniref:pre-mRNA-splicing factor CWC21-like isoform X3 n=1 Tax=Poecilia latipinna TaxID=48699 RepID=UPI00072DB054|nr:PREDICTED: pre-mRNA-splicing factor CWC21-like isoform X3 [Poecilia latipinna]
MRKSRKNRRDLGLLRSESEDDPRGFENISNGVPGTPRSFTIDSYTEAVSKEGEEEQNVATTAKRSHSKKVTQEEFVRNGLTSSDEEDDMRVVKLPIQSEAPEKLPIIQDTNRLNNISSEDEATSIRREVADGSQGIDMSTFRSVNQTLAYLLKAFSRSAGSLHRDVSNLSGFAERSNGPRGRETLMSSPRYANTAPRRSDPSSPRSRHGCVKDEILDGYNYRSSSGSRSRHRDEASRSRSRHYDAASGHREYSSRSRHRDGSSRSRSRHRDGPSRSRSRHRDEVSRSRSRHSAEASDQKIEVGPSHCLRMCSSGSSSTFCLISAIVLPANSPSLQSFTLTRWRPWKTL